MARSWTRNGVGDAGQPLQRRRRRGRRSARRRRCRWSATIGAASSRQQQVMQRGVGQHEPELPVPGRDGRRDGGCAGGSRPAAAAARSAAARWPAAAAAASSTSHSRRAAARSATMTANGLSSRCLRARSAAAAACAARVGGQVVAAEPLHGQDLPGPQQRRRGGDRVGLRPDSVRSPARRRRRHQPRPAGRAAGGLGVEPAVGRIVILGRAPRAHREAAMVVAARSYGTSRDDREPRPAVGAVDERVADTAGRRGRPARPGSRRRSRVSAETSARRGARPGALGAMANPAEPRPGRQVPRRDPVDPRQRRRLLLQQDQEPGHRRRVALDLGEHAVGVVADQPGQAEPGGQPVDKRAETDALHDALDADCRPDPPGHPSSVSRIPVRAAF